MSSWFTPNPRYTTEELRQPLPWKTTPLHVTAIEEGVARAGGAHHGMGVVAYSSVHRHCYSSCGSYLFTETANSLISRTPGANNSCLVEGIRWWRNSYLSFLLSPGWPMSWAVIVCGSLKSKDARPCCQESGERKSTNESDSSSKVDNRRQENDDPNHRADKHPI